MNRLHLMIVCLFTVALGTGIVVGMGIARGPGARGEPRGWLADQLRLTPEQSEKIKAIWSENLGSGKKHWDQRQQYRKERDDAVLALFTPEQKAAYDKIVEHYNGQVTAMDKERDASFDGAVEKTKAILNEQQRATYEEMLKKGFRGPPVPGGRGGPGSTRPGDQRNGPWHGDGMRGGGPGGPGGPGVGRGGMGPDGGPPPGVMPGGEWK